MKCKKISRIISICYKNSDEVQVKNNIFTLSFTKEKDDNEES